MTVNIALHPLSAKEACKSSLSLLRDDVLRKSRSSTLDPKATLRPKDVSKTCVANERT